MTKFTVLVIALVLAPCLESAVVVSRDLIANYPFLISPLPAPVPEEPIPEVVPETKPLPVEESPCDVCFGYMSTLIDQLTETVAVVPQLPEFVPELPPLEPEILPQPAPEVPVVVRPLPLPVFPQIANF